MALRLGFDLDGVLADMDGELARHAAILFGAPAGPSPPESPADADSEASDTGPDTAMDATPDPTGASDAPMPAELQTLRLSARQGRRLWKHVKAIENFWETLPESEPRIVERLAALASVRRWEIIFLTKRPPTAGRTSQLQSQRWLEAKGFPLPSVYVVQGSRGRIAAALDLDVIVDDRPENCLDVVVDSRARAVLVWRDDERRVPAAGRRLGIEVVSSVAACLEVLVQMDSAGSDDPGVMGRIRRWLGRKEPAMEQR